jgi:hypothetical protein
LRLSLSLIFSFVSLMVNLLLIPLCIAIVGSVVYLGVTRPDISYALHILS